MNLVVLQAVRHNGLEYPLFYSIWRKPKEDEAGLTKLDLVKQMLLILRESVSCRLWVAMDRWYLCKDFFVFLEAHALNWVTKAKRNTALYRRIQVPGRSELFVPVSPRQLIAESYKCLTAGRGLSAVAIADIYMKLPYETIDRKGKATTKKRLVAIAAVAAVQLKEDETKEDHDNKEDETATYKGAYLLSSNRFDAPREALAVCGKRWRFEVFFRYPSKSLDLRTVILLQRHTKLLILKWFLLQKPYFLIRYGS